MPDVAGGSVEQLLSGCTEQEQWVWTKISEGEIANFHERPGYGGPLDPKGNDPWPEGRVLRPEFLAMLLFSAPFQKSTPYQGYRIAGAWFQDELDLSLGSLRHQLWLDSCRFDSGLNLSGLSLEKDLSLEGSRVSGLLDLEGVHAEGSLFLGGGSEFTEVYLSDAQVGELLDMTGADVKGSVDLSGVEVAGSLFL